VAVIAALDAEDRQRADRQTAAIAGGKAAVEEALQDVEAGIRNIRYVVGKTPQCSEAVVELAQAVVAVHEVASRLF
jgi:hypothetical protein